MQFVHRSVPRDADVLCPCCHCLNRENQPLGNVEDHLLLYGMASTYDRWIHHGEALYAEPELDAEAHHHVEDDPHHHVEDGP
jgi:hypothetical protein